MSSETSAAELQAAATRAQADYDYEWAIDLFSAALVQLVPYPANEANQLEFDIQMDRAFCFHRLGHYPEGVADIDAAIKLAESMDDRPRRIRALNQAVIQLNDTGDIQQAKESTDLALSLARESRDPVLQVESLIAQGRLFVLQQDGPRLQNIAEELKPLLAFVEDQRLEGQALTIQGAASSFAGQAQQSAEELHRALALTQQVGDSENEAYILTLLGLYAQDMAAALRYSQDALAKYDNLRYRAWQLVLNNNVGANYRYLGLYRQTRYHGEICLAIAKRYPTGRIGGYLLNLSVAYLELEMFDEAHQMLREVFDLDSEGLPLNFQGSNYFNLGRLLLAQNRPEEALEAFAKAEIESGSSRLLVRILRPRAEASLEIGDWQQAFAATTEAIRLVELSSRVSGDQFTDSQAYWQHYLVLLTDPERDKEMTWPVLNQACRSMLGAIAQISDEGLRRNYLNKVDINRAIVEEWSKEAVARGIALAPLTQGTGIERDFQEQLTRVVETGLRMTAERDPDRLPNFIMNEFVELSGVERALLLLSDESEEDGFKVAAHIGLDLEDVTEVRAANQSIIGDSLETRQPRWRANVGHIPEAGIPELHLRSILVLPLTSQGKLLGLLYGDMRQIFGQFEQADLDLLVVLVTQAAAALENANWSRTLELRVEERTAELAESRRLLAITNERMSTELNFARDIQLSLLPLIFPAYPDRQEVTIHAALESAREIGGDFYDFYFLDDDHLCFLIGDVSGKGAPGALMMAVSKTLIKSRAADDSEPASILTHVNDELSQDNESSMFVTVFLGVINVKTGEMIYTNAGHNPPYIRRSDGSLQIVDAFHGPVVGAMPGLPYAQDSDVLQPGDTILIFTDGVTEAFNEAEELFSEERLEALLVHESFDSSDSMVAGTIEAVNRFAGGAEQSDDITVLAVQYLGLPAAKAAQELNITIKNRYEDMAIVEEQFAIFASDNKLQDPIRQAMSIVLDELLNNVISYAYQGETEKEIEINFELSGNRLVLTIKDFGVPFNPFILETPDIAESLVDREIGGLGIHLVRNLMDEVSYQRKINKNVVTLVKLLEDEGD